MDSEDEDFMLEEDEDSGNESEEAVESDFDIDCEEPSTPKRLHINDDFHYECLTPEALVNYMNEIVDEVNGVFQVSMNSRIIMLPLRAKTMFCWGKLRFGRGSSEEAFWLQIFFVHVFAFCLLHY